MEAGWELGGLPALLPHEAFSPLSASLWAPESPPPQLPRAYLHLRDPVRNSSRNAFLRSWKLPIRNRGGQMGVEVTVPQLTAQ